jgi:hypothetical protein
VQQHSIAARIGLLAKAKACVGYFQVVLPMPQVFGLRFLPQLV